MSELRPMLQAIETVGADSAAYLDGQTGHVVVVGPGLLSSRGVPGVVVQCEERPDGVIADLSVDDGVRVTNPIHLCFGMLQRMGKQKINIKITLGEYASADFLAHCIFSNAEQLSHAMDATIHLGKHARMHFAKSHFHGPFGGIEVSSKAVAALQPYAHFQSDFSLTTGRVGALDLDSRIEVEANGVAEISSRIFGDAADKVKIRDEAILAGEDSKGLIKSRIALDGNASGEITSITEGRARGARGHIDCMQIVRDRALATAVPIVKGSHPQSKITHEFVIGTVDQAQLETLMARGLTPEEAVNTIVMGLLR